MSRYIDADKLIYSYAPIAPVLKGDSIRYEWIAYEAEIDAMPTADVRENVKGRWIEYPDCLKYDGAIMQEDFVCPECKAVFNAIDNEGERFNFCPNCGADMRGANDD